VASNFEHINGLSFHQDLADAEQFGRLKPHLSGFLIRRTLEIMLSETCQAFPSTMPKKNKNDIVLDDLIKSFKPMYSKSASNRAYHELVKVKNMGNDAVHAKELRQRQGSFKVEDAILMLKGIHSFSYWFLKNVIRHDEDQESFDF
jgi:hypothetical protein